MILACLACLSALLSLYVVDSSFSSQSSATTETTKSLMQEECGQNFDDDFAAQVAKIGNTRNNASELKVTMTMDIVAIMIECIGAISLTWFGASAIWRLQRKSMANKRAADYLKTQAMNMYEAVDSWGCTALHRAAAQGDVTVAKDLLSRGAHVDARAAWEETPLHFAATFGHTEMCSLLITHGADMNAQNSDDESTLLVAARTGHDAVVDLLLGRGATVGHTKDSVLPLVLVEALTRRMVQPIPTK